MRTGILVTLALVLVTSGAAADDLPAFPPGAEAREAELITHVGPQARAWIAEEAKREAAMPELSEAIAVSAIQANFAVLGDMGDRDIMALAFIVMMEAARSAREDLKAIGKRSQKANAARDDQRTVLQTTPQATSGLAEPESVRPSPSLARMAATVTEPSPDVAPSESGQLVHRNDPTGELSEMGETRELQQLGLQTATARVSKMMSALSNILKKVSDTNSSILRNLK